MRRDVQPYVGKQYLRNDDKKEVHDLDNEKTGANQCQIDEIKNFTMFDGKDEALKGAGGHHCMLKDDTD